MFFVYYNRTWSPCKTEAGLTICEAESNQGTSGRADDPVKKMDDLTTCYPFNLWRDERNTYTLV